MSGLLRKRLLPAVRREEVFSVFDGGLPVRFPGRPRFPCSAGEGGVRRKPVGAGCADSGLATAGTVCPRWGRFRHLGAKAVSPGNGPVIGTSSLIDGALVQPDQLPVVNNVVMEL